MVPKVMIVKLMVRTKKEVQWGLKVKTLEFVVKMVGSVVKLLMLVVQMVNLTQVEVVRMRRFVVVLVDCQGGKGLNFPG